MMESDDRTSLVNQLETSNNAERPPLGSEHIESTEMEEAEKDEFDREDYEEQLLISNVCLNTWYNIINRKWIYLTLLFNKERVVYTSRISNSINIYFPWG